MLRSLPTSGFPGLHGFEWVLLLNLFFYIRESWDGLSNSFHVGPSVGCFFFLSPFHLRPRPPGEWSFLLISDLNQSCTRALAFLENVCRIAHSAGW
jgi:hypothetical protein